MIRKLNCAVLLLPAIALVAGGCQRKVDLAKERNSLRAVDAQWSAAANNPESFVSFISPSGVIYPPNEAAIVGPENARTWASQLMSTPGFSISWQTYSVDVAASGDLGYTTGTYELRMQAPDGSPITDNGKYVTVWTKDKDGNWKVSHDIFNSAVPLSTHEPVDTTATDDMQYERTDDK